MGIVTRDRPNMFNLIHPPTPQAMKEEEESEDINDVLTRMDDLKLQVGVIDECEKHMFLALYFIAS